MEGPNRSRASSAGQIPNVHFSHSPSAQHISGHNPRQDLSLPLNPSNFATDSFDTGIISSSPTSDLQYNYIAATAQFDHPVVPSNGFIGHGLDQPMQSKGVATDLRDRPLALSIQHPHQFRHDLPNVSTTNTFDHFTQQQHHTSKPTQRFDGGFFLDAEIHTGMQPQNASINPADIMNLPSPQNSIPSPLSLMPPETRSSRQSSPAPAQGQYYSPNHSRHTSLDPSSAIFAHNPHQTDWSLLQFQGHRRAPSEHSDVSSSVAPSPFLAQTDNFELDYNPSPLIHPLQDNPIYPGLGMEQISLSDPQQEQHQQQHQSRMTPGHTPYDSPRISPHMGFGIPREDLMLPPDLGGAFSGGPGPDIYPNQPEQFPQFNPRHDSSDMGQAAQMTPPDITVEFVPVMKQPNFESLRTDNDQDALSPPARGQPQSPKKVFFRCFGMLIFVRSTRPSSITVGGFHIPIRKRVLDLAPSQPHGRGQSPPPAVRFPH